MSRGKLLTFLPDFSAGTPPRREPRAPGFEPLVRDAAAQPEFTPIDMPVCFAPNADDDDMFAPAIRPDDDGAREIADLGFDFDGPALDLSPDPGPDGGAPDIDFGAEVDGTDVFAPEEQTEEAALEQPAEGDQDAAPLPGDVDTVEALHASHQEELAQMEAVYQTALRDLVETSIPLAKTEIVDAISAELVPLLAVHLRASIADKMVAALIAEIGKVLADDSPVAFEVRGPEKLLLAFREQWQEGDVKPKLTPSDGIDLVARIDKSVLATRLSDVESLLQEIVA